MKKVLKYIRKVAEVNGFFLSASAGYIIMNWLLGATTTTDGFIIFLIIMIAIVVMRSEN